MAIIEQKPDMIIAGEKFYRVESLAKILNLNEDAVRRYFRLGKFPKFKQLKRWYMSEANLKKYILARSLKNLSNNELIEVINKVIDQKLKENFEILIPLIKKNTRQVLNIYEKRLRESLKKEKRSYPKREEREVLTIK